MKTQEVVVFCISYCLVAIESVNVKVVQRKEVISNKQSIHSRDKIVEERNRIGDIEIDSVVGTFNQAGIERKSRYNMARLVKNKTGDETLLKSYWKCYWYIRKR